MISPPVISKEFMDLKRNFLITYEKLSCVFSLPRIVCQKFFFSLSLFLLEQKEQINANPPAYLKAAKRIENTLSQSLSRG